MHAAEAPCLNVPRERRHLQHSVIVPRTQHGDAPMVRCGGASWSAGAGGAAATAAGLARPIMRRSYTRTKQSLAATAICAGFRFKVKLGFGHSTSRV